MSEMRTVALNFSSVILDRGSPVYFCSVARDYVAECGVAHFNFF